MLSSLVTFRRINSLALERGHARLPNLQITVRILVFDKVSTAHIFAQLATMNYYAREWYLLT